MADGVLSGYKIFYNFVSHHALLCFFFGSMRIEDECGVE